MVSDDAYDEDKTRPLAVLTKGLLVGHYRILEKIGAGGMGEVYLADDAELDRKVALKFLSPHLCRDADCRARFKREAQAAAKLSHPNIVTIFEVSEFNGRPFFAMEHIEGESLADFIKKRDHSIEKIIDLSIQICEGLNKAHQAGITHRDIKPSNILTDHDGRAKILDFGLASIKGIDKLTKTGSTLGTLHYMSPEQTRGEEVDQRSDIFSFGAVLYEMITGQLPFKGDHEPAVIYSIGYEEPEPLVRYKSGVPDELQRIVGKMLAKDRTARYQHADDLLADLRTYSKEKSSSIGGKPRRAWRIHYVVAAAAVILLAIVGYWGVKTYVLSERKKPEFGRKMLAVLPFANLGAPDQEYFADGITEEITTCLAGLSGLGVISRTSSMQYKNTDKGLKQIGKELDVDYILEGTIRWEKKGSESRVRISPQLIRVSDDLHLWANKYDAVLTDVFEAQSTIAQEVAAALDVTLLQTEQEMLSRKTEIDPRAYDYYLRGKQYFSIARYSNKDLRLAEMMHLKATELAPDFAPAYAELGSLYTEMYWDLTDPSPQRLESAKKMIDMAIYLAPNTPEAHQALGWYYYHGLRDYERALQEFSIVLKLQPNNALAIASTAWVQRRQGKWDEAIDALQLASKLDPRDPWYKYELGVTYHYCHRYPDAIAQFDQVIDLQPNHLWAYLVKSWALFNQTGEIREARGVLAAGRACNGRWPELTWLEVYYDLCDNDYNHALSLMTAHGDVLFPGNPDSSDYYSLKGFTYVMMEQRKVARVYFDSARVRLESKLSTAPNSAPLLSSLANVYAGLGQSDKAIQMARRATELNPVSADALNGPDYVRVLAIAYAQGGEQDQAIELSAYLLTIPSNLSANLLKLSPELASLRGNPRFQALLKKYEKEHGT